MHVAGAGAGLGHHRTVPARQLPVAGLAGHGGQPGRAVRRDPGGHQAAARRCRGGRGQPPQPDQLAADLVQAGAHPGAGLHLEPHQLLLDPRLPAEHPHQLRGGQHGGAVRRVQEHELLLHPQRDRGGRAPPPAGHRAPSRPVPHRPIRASPRPPAAPGAGVAAAAGPSALARPAIARAAGISGHSSAATVMEAAACTATASAPASATTCPAASRVASSGCPAGIGRAWVIAWSFLSFRTPRSLRLPCLR